MPGTQSETPRATFRSPTIRGESRISVPDYAAAIVDALENGRFVGERFTAAY